jgi:hypothetical protein
MLKNRVDERLRQVLPRPTYHSARGMYYGARKLARRNPGRGRVLPDFLIIGSTKCGTTSLHDWLIRHPLVAPTNKEIDFFNLGWYRGPDWYRCYFPLDRDCEAFASQHGRRPLVGEASANYLAHYWTPQRVAKLVPEARLIVSLRDPVDRAYSHYQMIRRRGTEPLDTFEEAIASEEGRLRGDEEREAGDLHYHSWRTSRWGYLRASRYAEQLERWFAVFPRDSFLFLNFHTDIAAQPQRSLDAVHSFLGLPPRRDDDLPVRNAGSYDSLADDTRKRLTDYFRPHNGRLYELTGIDFGWPC